MTRPTPTAATPQEPADGPESAPEGPNRHTEAPEGLNGPQTGAYGLGGYDEGPSVREAAHDDRAHWSAKYAEEGP